MEIGASNTGGGGGGGGMNTSTDRFYNTTPLSTVRPTQSNSNSPAGGGGVGSRDGSRTGTPNSNTRKVNSTGPITGIGSIGAGGGGGASHTHPSGLSKRGSFGNY